MQLPGAAFGSFLTTSYWQPQQLPMPRSSSSKQMHTKEANSQHFHHFYDSIGFAIKF
jgi:hypothetical protein